MDVKRYECWPENPAQGIDGKMFEDRAGKWNKHDDYAALREHAERLAEALQEARAFIAVVECEAGLTTDNLIEKIDKALALPEFICDETGVIEEMCAILNPDEYPSGTEKNAMTAILAIARKGWMKRTALADCNAVKESK